MKPLVQFSKYGGVAAGSTLTDYTVFSILLFFGCPLMIAQATSRISGGGFSFLVNKRWSFQVNSFSRLSKEVRRFIYLFVVSYILALLLVYVANKIFLIPIFPAKIAADFICFIFNFILLKYYVFSEED